MRACLKKQFLDDAFVPVGWLVFLSDISTTERACINPAACYDFPFGLISFKKKKISLHFCRVTSDNIQLYAQI